jgi:charged multivesicular body protein 4
LALTLHEIRPLTTIPAAKSALRRKKQFEHSLEQTSSQIMTLEREIYSIETANINKETLDAMKNAGTAMKHIHADLTIDKVDNIMYAHTFYLPTSRSVH